MLYFKIMCRALKSYKFEGHRELKKFMDIVAPQAEEFSAAFAGRAAFYLTQFKKDRFAVMVSAGVDFLNRFCVKDECARFLEHLEVAAEPEEPVEITPKQYHEALFRADRMGFLGEMFDCSEGFEETRRISERYARCSEKILEETYTKTKALKRADTLLCAKSMEPELDRIFAGTGPARFTAHPVHYTITSNDDKLQEKMIEILLGSLLANGRLLSRRFSRFYVSGEHPAEAVALRAKYSNAEGGTIALEFIVDESESEFADAAAGIIREACAIVKEYRKTVLTVFCFKRGKEKLQACVAEHLDKVTFVQLTEETVFADKAKEYLKSLAKEKGVKNTASLVKALPKAEKGYLAADLNKIFDNWYDKYLRTGLYPQYAVLETTGKKTAAPKGSAYRDLQEMIGLTEAKKVLGQALDYYKAQKLFKEKGVPSEKPAMHMIFTGNPGTAKTSVARLIARIMKDNNLLADGDLIEVGRGDLVGKYVGWTAKIVKEKFAMAKGSVLFIDEAYSLVDDRNGLFGDEAINTIVQEMENARDSTIVIFAGYPEKMEGFLNKNPGLRSRIAFHVSFPDYTQDELMDITRLMVKNQKLTLAPEAESVIREILAKGSATEDFGNGRFVRNLLEKARMKQATRLVTLDPDAVTAEDICTLSAADFEMPEQLKNASTRIGF